MWTRYYDEATEAVKEEHAFSSHCSNVDSDSYMQVSGKPNGLYLAQDSAWYDWCVKNHMLAEFGYTHKKVLLNAHDFHILTITIDNLARYTRPFPGIFNFFKMLDWRQIREEEGYDGVHIPEALIIQSMRIFIRHHIQFDVFDVETLVIWNNKKKPLQWSEPICL